MQFIAEVKTHSPFGWKSTKTWNELFEVAERIGDMISIHTDPRWHGSFDLIREARRRTDKPILAKGIHATDQDIQLAIDAGANYVLVVGRIPTVHFDKCLIEPYTLEELAKIPTEIKAVWNSRDLSTGGMKSASFSDARKVFSGWLCQASNIASKEDIDPTADAVLIGTNILAFEDRIGS